MIQLQDSLNDLQELAARIESGEMHRDDVLWRLQSYFHAVGVVLDECGGSGEPSEPVRQAVSVLQSIQSQVQDLVLEISERERTLDQDSLGHSVLPSRKQTPSLAASIIPFPTRQKSDPDESW